MEFPLKLHEQLQILQVHPKVYIPHDRCEAVAVIILLVLLEASVSVCSAFSVVTSIHL
jgi:hypothetical protein